MKKDNLYFLLAVISLVCFLVYITPEILAFIFFSAFLFNFMVIVPIMETIFTSVDLTISLLLSFTIFSYIQSIMLYFILNIIFKKDISSLFGIFSIAFLTSIPNLLVFMFLLIFDSPIQ
tara:strand:+ start:39319 stop:39675 length:357 start_codon:yes stop_codon:yes gene_type:complete